MGDMILMVVPAIMTIMVILVIMVMYVNGVETTVMLWHEGFTHQNRHGLADF